VFSGRYGATARVIRRAGPPLRANQTHSRGGGNVVNLRVKQHPWAVQRTSDWGVAARLIRVIA
jgi:hypothetical protein